MANLSFGELDPVPRVQTVWYQEASCDMKRIYTLTQEDLRWAFQSGGANPYVLTGGRKHGYPSRTGVDPFPAYPHDTRLVRETLKQVEQCVSIRFKPSFYILPWEPPERTNGWASRDHDYDEEQTWEGTIVLAGKRIPPHPAVTRYLVAHEYGHHVQYDVERRRGMKRDFGEILPEYMKIRRMEAPAHYGGGTWHASPGELFANDFRILACEIEPDYWPHPGFTRPEKLTTVKRWWEENLTV